MKTTSVAKMSESPSQPSLTLFNLAQVLEIPLFPGFSRKLFRITLIPAQSTFAPSEDFPAVIPAKSPCRYVVASLSRGMLTFPSQVPAFTIFTLKKEKEKGSIRKSLHFRFGQTG
jgi:hypothetical protein